MNTPERVIFNIRDKFDRDMFGWECKNQTPFRIGLFEPKLVEFLSGGETIISGEEMIRRAKEMDIYTGLRHAESMIRGQVKISEAWRKFVSVFPEVWLGPGGREYVWCLYGDSKIWEMRYDELRHGFNADYRLVSA
jgi:hypothetical protein